MKRLLLIGIVCGLFGCANNGVGPDKRGDGGEASSVKFTSEESLLPLANGNRWKLLSDDRVETWTISGDSVIGGVRYAKLYVSHDEYSGLLALYRAGDDGAIYKREHNGHETAFYPDRINSVYLNGPDSIRVSGIATKETASGILTDCIRFDVSPAPIITESGETIVIVDGDYSLTFKPGIGFVASSNDWFREVTLVEYSVKQDYHVTETAETCNPVRFDFQQDFNHTQVRCTIDGEVAYNGILTTNYTLSFAGSFEINLSDGIHTLHCAAGAVDYDTTFTVATPLVIGITSSAETGIGTAFYYPGNFPVYY